MMTHTLAVFYHPVEDVDAFRDYYTAVHLPLVRELPGVRAIRYSLDVTGLAAAAPYVAVFEADFATAGALAAALASPEGQRAQADTANFASGGITILQFEAVS